MEFHVKLTSLIYNNKLNLDREVGERSRAEKVLRDSEARFQSLYDCSMDAILLTIPDGRILAANQAARRLIGATEEEIIKLGRSEYW